jgi:hypothetical protein
MRFQRRRAALLGVVLSGATLAGLPLAAIRPTSARSADPVAPVAPVAEAADGRRPGLTLLSPQQAIDWHHEFYFTRAVYSSGGGFGFRGRGGNDWATDYPKADRQFMVVLNRLIGIDASPDENAVRLDDPNIRRYPFLYALEVGDMNLSDGEIEGLRGYLAAGGFLVIDDFWGPGEYANFESEMRRLLPGRPIYEVPRSHGVFNNVYDVANVVQVPNIRNGQMHEVYGTPTWECDNGCQTPRVFGIDDDDGELMVLINWNTDIGDAWEWAENPYYPLRFSTYAFEIGVNMIVYAMSH